MSAEVVYIVQETSDDEVEYVFKTLEHAEKYVKQFDGVDTGYRFRIMKGIVWESIYDM